VSVSISSPCNLDQRYCNSPLRCSNGQLTQIIKGTIDPEKVADAILEASGAFSEGNGIYTKAQLYRKMRMERKKSPEVEEYGLPKEVEAELVERCIDELIELSRLSVSQEVVLRMHLCGMHTSYIANTLKISHQTAAYRLKSAKQKIMATYKEGKYAGWYEVYLSEVNRPVYRPRKRSLQN